MASAASSIRKQTAIHQLQNPEMNETQRELQMSVIQSAQTSTLWLTSSKFRNLKIKFETKAGIQDGDQTGSGETCGGGPAPSLSSVLPVAENGISSATTNLNFGSKRKQ